MVEGIQEVMMGNRVRTNMTRRAILPLLLLGLGCSSSDKEAKKIDRSQSATVVEFDSLKATPPASWKEEPPSNQMRYFQFRLPRVEGDSADAELVIFKALGGTAEANIDRWKAQFQPPEGKKIDDVAKVEELKIAGCQAMYLDVQGTYLEGPPNMQAGQKTKRENYRLLGVHFEGPSKVYHIKLTGPAATVAEYKKGFDEWLKSFK